jgi:DNA repair protein RadD
MSAEAVERSVRFLTSKSDKHGLLILPTGSGKSLVIASIVNALDAPCLVFQPSREILRQNFTKLMAYGFRPAVYSASLGKKQISGAVTLATIGSVVNKPEYFDHIKFFDALEQEALADSLGFIEHGRALYYVWSGVRFLPSAPGIDATRGASPARREQGALWAMSTGEERA